MRGLGTFRWTWAVVFCLALATSVKAQIDETPDAVDGLGVTEHLNELLPLDTPFTDDRGAQIRLGDYFDGKKPVILSLNYSNCPMLCQQQLNGLVRTLSEMDASVGEDFHVVSISIDPRESYQKASKTRMRYYQEYDRPGTAEGWHFLVGESKSIMAVAKATGFQYRYVPERKEYAHNAVLMLCTPDGRISRYMYGVQFDEPTLRLSLVEASEGKIGTTVDQIILTCFMYDETSGRYGPQAIRLMQLGAFTTVACLAIGLIPFWLLRRKASTEKEKLNSNSMDGHLPSSAT
ncbi:SCO family protein [Blastopirellula marina]|uniref:SCO family protein n=1 Tax=Blastopirellula marina TaxID=124 RepID=A0A2S8EZA3_9BACT|nr:MULTISPECIES: SCO family protein [Pirellulaceae]PQO25233.1 SCO family protein [Blastopirellula marina]RCS41666.1 SCO family protein [Bremerella cremea]